MMYWPVPIVMTGRARFSHDLPVMVLYVAVTFELAAVFGTVCRNETMLAYELYCARFTEEDEPAAGVMVFWVAVVSEPAPALALLGLLALLSLAGGVVEVGSPPALAIPG